MINIRIFRDGVLRLAKIFLNTTTYHAFHWSNLVDKFEWYLGMKFQIITSSVLLIAGADQCKVAQQNA